MKLKKKYHIFGKKEILSFRVLQKRSYSGAIFWKDHPFRAFGKRKYDFSFRAISTSNRMVSSAINDKFDEGN